METRMPGSYGLLGSLRGLVDGLLQSAHDRFELLTVELQEEKYRLIQIFIWINAIVFFTMLAFVFASMALVVLFWETSRVAVVCSLTTGYVIATLAAVIGFRRCLKRQPKPFSDSLRELREDRECIRTEN